MDLPKHCNAGGYIPRAAQRERDYISLCSLYLRQAQTLHTECGESAPYESGTQRGSSVCPARLPPGVSGPIAKGGGPARSVRLRTEASLRGLVSFSDSRQISSILGLSAHHNPIY